MECVHFMYYFIQHGGDVVRYHRLNLSTPLHQAARGGHEEIVKLVLSSLPSHLMAKLFVDFS